MVHPTGLHRENHVPRLQSGVGPTKQRVHFLLYRRGHGDEVGAQVRYQNDGQGNAPVGFVVVRDGAEHSPRNYAFEEMLAGDDDRVRDLKVFDVAHEGPHSWCWCRLEVVVGRSDVDNHPDARPVWAKRSERHLRRSRESTKNPEDKPWSGAGDREEIDKGAAGVAAGAVEGVWEKTEHEVAADGGTRWAQKENPNDVGSAGACGTVAGVDCV